MEAWWRRWARAEATLVLVEAPDLVVATMNRRGARTAAQLFDQPYTPLGEPSFETTRSYRSARVLGRFEPRPDGCELRVRVVPSGLDWTMVALAVGVVLVAAWLVAVSAVRTLVVGDPWPGEANVLTPIAVVAGALVALVPWSLRWELARFRAALERALRNDS